MPFVKTITLREAQALLDDRRWEAAMRRLLWSAAARAPVRTGRLRESGSAFWKGRLIATTHRTRGTPLLNDPFPSGGAIIFSTPKPAGPEAQVFYVEGGRRWFDYAPKAHQAKPYLWWITADRVIDEVMR